MSIAKQRICAEMYAEQECDVLCIQKHTGGGQKEVRTRIRGMRLVAEIPHEQYRIVLVFRSDYICDSTSISTSTTNNVQIIQAQLNNIIVTM